MTTPLFQRTTCQVCLTDPFEENPELESCTWNGHYVKTSQALSSETRIIHGLCEECFLRAPSQEQLLKCFTCRQVFSINQRSSITITRNGNLLSEETENIEQERISLQSNITPTIIGTCFIGLSSSAVLIVAMNFFKSSQLSTYILFTADITAFLSTLGLAWGVFLSLNNPIRPATSEAVFLGDNPSHFVYLSV